MQEKGWGDKNRFIFSIEPWYIGGGITKEEIRNLPKNTNFVLQQYGTKGDNNGNDISGKVPLTQYYLLDSINNRQKDYQTIDGLNHGYPHNEVNQMPYLVNPLEALMKYTFTGSNNESLRLSALDIGNDDPYTTHKQILNNNKPCRNNYNNYNNIYNTINHCKNFIPTLISGEEVERDVKLDEMIYYKVSATNGQTINILLNGLNDDADMYIKVGDLPTTSSNDFKSENSGTNSESKTFTLNEDSDVYIGIRGYRATDYKLKTTISGIGNNNYETLDNGIDIEGIANKYQYKYYKIEASAGDNVTVKLHDMDADGDLYVKVGSEASRTLWDCKSTHNNKNDDDSCSVTLNEDATVYIAVYAAQCINNVQHKIRATIGENNDVMTLTSGMNTEGIADKHQYKYYKIEASAGDVTVKLHGMDADGDLYVKVGSQASKQSGHYDCKSTHGDTTDDSCTVTLAEDDTVYIAVYAAVCQVDVQHEVQVLVKNNNHIILSSGVDVEGIADKDQYTYYKIEASAGDVTVKLHGMDADGDLYVKVGSQASKQSGHYDCKSTHGNTTEDSCTVTLEEDDTVYIAVYAAVCQTNVQHKIKATIQ